MTLPDYNAVYEQFDPVRLEADILDGRLDSGLNVCHEICDKWAKDPQRIGKGDRVAGLLPRGPKLLIVIAGALRAGAVYQPLFTAFGKARLRHQGVRRAPQWR
jgi:acetyl-CoA synthetase